MKKHLLAVAVLSAFAAPAMSQVTVYGIIDTGFQSYDNGVGTGAASLNRASDSLLASSRIGFKGSEDLGGGLKANFVLEGSLAPSTGVATSFSRGAWVGVSGAFGEVRLGRGDTTNTQDIDAIVGQAGNFSNRATIHTTASAAGVSGELGSDVSNAIRYISPTFSGFSVELGIATNLATATTDAQTDIQDVYVQYANGPVKAMIGNTKQNAATAALKANFTAYGASYDFGVASLGVTGSQADANLAGDVKTFTISAKAPLGNGLNAHLVRSTASVSGVANAEGSGTTVALTKSLSKRTTVYGAYTAAAAKSAATFIMGGVTTGALDSDPTAASFGIAHSF